MERSNMASVYSTAKVKFTQKRDCPLCARQMTPVAFNEGVQAKEKRGWTLNSAGYLLGPHAVDNHRSLNDKHGLAGKRNLQMEDDIKTDTLRLADENIIRTVIDFLSYLRLREMGALDNLPSSFTSEEVTQP